MSVFGARLFDFMQGADFYRNLHEDAAALVDGYGGAWLDAGCGPGLFTRIAAARGFEAIGVDRSADMIALARRRAQERGSAARFEIGDALAEDSRRFDVVSASSLLAVVSDRDFALGRLLARVKPTGGLLIVEPTAHMTPQNARRLWRTGLLGRRGYMLLAWAQARQGRSSPPLRLPPSYIAVSRELLDGLVHATRIARRDDVPERG